MLRLASILLSELRPSATRLMYDSQFLANSGQDGDAETLKETYQDLLSSTQDITRWTGRLQRFVEQGTGAREALGAAELVHLAGRLASRAVPELEITTQGLDTLGPSFTNLFLASQVLAESFIYFCPDPRRLRLLVEAGPENDHSMVLSLSLLRKVQGDGLHLVPHRPSMDPGEADSPSAFEVMAHIAKELGGSLTFRDATEGGSLEFSLPNAPSEPSSRSQS